MFSPVRTADSPPRLERALTALECSAAGKPWPVWSEPDRTAVAIVLGDDEQLAADGFHIMLGLCDGSARVLGSSSLLCRTRSHSLRRSALRLTRNGARGSGSV
jgi:hypothetical protein